MVPRGDIHSDGLDTERVETYRGHMGIRSVSLDHRLQRKLKIKVSHDDTTRMLCSGFKG
jgi:hypothetical protein